MAGNSDSKLKRDMGLIGLLFACVGSIIGSGWLFGALYAAEAAGPASIISWLLGGILMMFIALCYAELGTMFPVSGGVVRYPHFAFGSFASYTTGWITWFAAASTTAIEVLAALQYATTYLPWLMEINSAGAIVLEPWGYVVAIALLALFTGVNFIGILWFEKLNNALVWWKLAILLLVIIVFFVVAFHGGHFNNPETGGFFPYGWEGVFSAIATAGVVFSFLGFRQGVELAGETDNPSRNVPIAVIGSILITAVLYVLLQVAFIGTLPARAFVEGWANIGMHFAGGTEVVAVFGPLAAMAVVMGLSWLAVLLYIDAFISPADTGLIYTTVTSRLSYAMGLNGNAPRSLAKVNDDGVPYVSVALTFLAATAFFFLFPSWEKIVGFVTAGTVLSFGLGPVALLAMRKQVPEQERPFKLPWAKILSYLAFVAANLIVYWSGWTDVWKLMIATIIGFGILIIHETANSEHTPDLEFRHGAWMIVWLIGLTIISYFGSYPLPSAGAGNTGLLDVGIDIVVIAIFDLFIVWLAVKSRLPKEKALAHINEPVYEIQSGEEVDPNELNS